MCSQGGSVTHWQGPNLPVKRPLQSLRTLLQIFQSSRLLNRSKWGTEDFGTPALAPFVKDLWSHAEVASWASAVDCIRVASFFLARTPGVAIVHGNPVFVCISIYWSCLNTLRQTGRRKRRAMISAGLMWKEKQCLNALKSEGGREWGGVKTEQMMKCGFFQMAHVTGIMQIQSNGSGVCHCQHLDTHSLKSEWGSAATIPPFFLQLQNQVLDKR